MDLFYIVDTEYQTQIQVIEEQRALRKIQGYPKETAINHTKTQVSYCLFADVQ